MPHRLASIVSYLPVDLLLVWTLLRGGPVGSMKASHCLKTGWTVNGGTFSRTEMPHPQFEPQLAGVPMISACKKYW